VEIGELGSKKRQDGANRLIWVIRPDESVDESHIYVARRSQVCDESWPEGSTTGRKEDGDDDCHVIRQYDLKRYETIRERAGNETLKGHEGRRGHLLEG
jgi:hypothetical protein